MKLKFELFLLETNIALNRPTKQSSTYSNEISYHAVDGNTDGVQGHGSCTHTENTNEAWWRVDLGSAKRVKRVVIYNRLGSFGSRLHNFDIHVGKYVQETFSIKPGVCGCFFYKPL